MIYKVIETLPSIDNVKPEKSIKEFESVDILEAKSLAEKYFFERYLKSSGTVELRFTLKSNNRIHFLSEDDKMHDSKIEAKRISELTGYTFNPINWSKRLEQLKKEYVKSK